MKSMLKTKFEKVFALVVELVDTQDLKKEKKFFEKEISDFFRFYSSYNSVMIYKKLIKDRISDDAFIKACNDSNSMAEAAAYLNLHFNSFKKRALELNSYRPNQSGKGLKKISPQIPLSEIIEKGIYPHYQTYKLKNNVCEICGCTSWLDKQLNLELHHADGNRQNHILSNLKMLCPNCHSQTDFFRAKNKKI